MKKFTKSIEVNFENIQEILKCPLVEGIRKESVSIYEDGRSNPYVMNFRFILDVYGFDLPFNLESGCVLALDVCGTWYAFTKEEWNRHKNDEI